jgi:hypothetical protein
MNDFDYTTRILPARPTRRGSYAGPFLAIILGIVVLILTALSAFAQSSESRAESEASSEVEVTTGAAAGAAINNYGQKPGKDNTVYAEVSSAPSLGGLALGGGHPCAYSPATAQVSLIGGGAGIGGMKVDSACMLMVMGAAGDAKAYKASQYIIATRDPIACRAMERAGMLDCVTREERKAGAAAAKKDFSAKATAASTKGTNTGWGAKCQLTGKKLAFQPTSKAARGAELSACKARYGLN